MHKVISSSISALWVLGLCCISYINSLCANVQEALAASSVASAKTTIALGGGIIGEGRTTPQREGGYFPVRNESDTAGGWARGELCGHVVSLNQN